MPEILEGLEELTPGDQSDRDDSWAPENQGITLDSPQRFLITPVIPNSTHTTEPATIPTATTIDQNQQDHLPESQLKGVSNPFYESITVARNEPTLIHSSEGTALIFHSLVL
jgi:hypothetical protein